MVFLSQVKFHYFPIAVFDSIVMVYKILWQQGLILYIVLLNRDLFGPKNTGNIVTDCFTSLGWNHKCATTILGLVIARDPVERILTITMPGSPLIWVDILTNNWNIHSSYFNKCQCSSILQNLCQKEMKQLFDFSQFSCCLRL